MGWVVNAKTRPITPGNDSVLMIQEAGWALGPVWAGGKIRPPPTGIRFPDSAAHSESLYQLRYSGPLHSGIPAIIWNVLRQCDEYLMWTVYV
jgi:hypothetical protein